MFVPRAEGDPVSTIRERHIGIVTDNGDDEKRGRIRVASASLMGVDTEGEPLEYPVWIEPAFPHLLVSDETSGVVDSGFFYVPNVGTTVEFELTVSSSVDKSFGQSSIGNPDPRWVACLLLPGDELSPDFTENYPNRFGWRSRKGSILLFDDTDEKETVVLRGPDVGGSNSSITFETDGSIGVETSKGQSIRIDVNGEITLTTRGKVKLDAPKVELGGRATEALIKGTTFQALFNGHTHPFVGNLGVAGATLTPLVPLTGAELSLVSSTE